MLIDGHEFMIDNLSKFYNSILIKGWFIGSDCRLSELSISGGQAISCLTKVSLPHGGVGGDHKDGPGFFLQALFRDEIDPRDLDLVLLTSSGQQITANCGELAAERLGRSYSFQLAQNFYNQVNSAASPCKVLDVGGRARSRIDRKDLFPKADYTVIDIVDGDNVDIVGDAHTMSGNFPSETFDFILSVSVFEHLIAHGVSCLK